MMEEIKLEPGWLRKDTKRAVEQIKNWNIANDERMIPPVLILSYHHIRA
jgi:hypothetical protein